MNIAEWILVSFLSVALLLFLILGIVALIKWNSLVEEALREYLVKNKETMNIDSYLGIILDKKRPLDISSVQAINNLIGGRKCQRYPLCWQPRPSRHHQICRQPSRQILQKARKIRKILQIFRKIHQKIAISHLSIDFFTKV